MKQQTKNNPTTRKKQHSGKNKLGNMRTIQFETELGIGYIEVIERNDARNLTFDVIVEEVYSFYKEEDVIADIEKNIYKYL